MESSKLLGIAHWTKRSNAAAVDSLDRSIKEDLSGLDENTIYLTKYSFGPTTVPAWQRDNFPQTEYDDFEFVNRNIADIEASAYVIFGGPQSIRYQDVNIASVNITPVSSEIYEVDNLKIGEGRFYTEAESYTGAPVIVIGYKLAENLFGKDQFP